MLRTGDLRRQHHVALSMVDAINASIKEMGEEPTLSGVFRLTISIAKLSGTLRIHFAQEDRHLYPSLMASGQGGVAATARRFLEEMGQIGPALNAFTEKWRDSATIVRNWAISDQRLVKSSKRWRLEFIVKTMNSTHSLMK